MLTGKLTLDAIPEDPIVRVTIVAILILGVAIVAAITYYGKWKYLWSEWLTSVDHKKLGIMYIIVAFVMLLRGFSDAIMMRSQQYWPHPEWKGRGICRPGTTIKFLRVTV